MLGPCQPPPYSRGSSPPGFPKDYYIAQASGSRRLRGQTPISIKAFAPVVLRYEKYQDTLHVTSTESEGHQRAQQLAGARHYVEMHHHKGITSKPSLDHIDDTALSRPLPDSSSPSSLTMDAQHQPHPRAPLPPSPSTAYAAPIYSGKTYDPAVFLAILCIAQQNLPSLNLISASNHIPNIKPTDALPTLLPAAPGNLAAQPFLDTQSSRPKREGDEALNVAFLPDFYDRGTRHALGYFQILRCPKRGRVLGTAFFTPCTEADLRRYGLVEYVDPLDGFVDGGVETMSRVACKDGEWRERDTVEEYEEWKLMFRVASVTWEARMGLIRGDVES